MHQSKVELQHTNIRHMENANTTQNKREFATLSTNICALIENERVEHMKKQRVWTENESTTKYVRISNNRILVSFASQLTTVFPYSRISFLELKEFADVV